MGAARHVEVDKILTGIGGLAPTEQRSFYTQAIEAIERHTGQSPHIPGRLPPSMTDQFRAERLVNIQRIAAIVGIQAEKIDLRSNLFQELGKVFEKVPELVHLHAKYWSSTAGLFTHFLGPKTDHIKPLKGYLEQVVSLATPLVVQQTLVQTLERIDFQCFAMPTHEAVVCGWLAPERADELKIILERYSPVSRVPALKGERVPDPVRPAQPEALVPASAVANALTLTPPPPAPSVQTPTLAEVLLPQINRNAEAAQIAIQVGKGIMFAQAGDGQQIVISNTNGAVSITMKTGQ